MKIPSKTDEELKQIATDLCEGKIFCDRYLQNPKDLPMVFMMIPMGAFAEWEKEEVEDIGLVYEYMSEASPRSINGYPIFMSLKVLNQEDTKKVIVFGRQYTEFKQQFIGEPS